jgi:formiminotetrahydrofolate cyclodeaminase
MRNLTLDQFLSQLAARQPTPGGGSASALGASIGAALASMSAVYSTGEKFLQSAQAQALDEKFATLRIRFLDLVDQDVAAYGAYAAARSLPKGTPEEKKSRSDAMKAANEQSTIIPERIVETTLDAFKLLEELSGVANPNLAGDVAVAAYFLEAAARGAGIQVMSNCASPDTDGKNAARREAMAQKIAAAASARERIDQAVRKLLKL